jgi:NAD(P)H-dependent flavin oxidoreductase YrpB (nitropropane dioxygenase family)
LSAQSAGRGGALLHAVVSAARFRRLTGLSWTAMLREGLAMRHGRELSWTQVVMAANTPMLLRSGLVEGRTDAGVLAAGQVVGLLDDLPSVAEVISNVVDQTVEVIRRLGDDL